MDNIGETKPTGDEVVRGALFEEAARIATEARMLQGIVQNEGPVSLAAMKDWVSDANRLSDKLRFFKKDMVLYLVSVLEEEK